MQSMRTFSVDWKTTLLTVVLLPLMITLGFWQLHRADEKRLIQQDAIAKQALPPVALEELVQSDTSAMQFRRVRLKGVWQEPVLLLDNQVQHGKPGYHVLGLVVLDNGHAVLVNRGWVPMLADRNSLPEIPLSATGDEVGEIYATAAMQEDEPVFAETGSPMRIQRLHLPELSRRYDRKLMPFIVRLSVESPSALSPEWPVINMLPEKHVAYAVQWFSMSAALVFFYFFLGFRRKPGS